jgi:hypothetical protein
MHGSADRWYGLLLPCYPPDFRARYEEGMRDAIRRDYNLARSMGAAAVLAFWFWTSVDAIRFGCAERGPRRQGGFSMRSFFAVDLRDAFRSLRANPVITIVAVVSLALGIGANAALFSILNSLLLKTLPVRDPARLVVIADGSWTNPIWEQIRERRHELLEDAFAWDGWRFNLSASGATDFVDGAWASGNMFTVLGVNAALGRTFTERDDVRGGGPDGPVAVISYGFWQRRMGGTPDAIGRHLTVDGIDVTVIGLRMALGADPGSVVRLVLGRLGWLLAAGMALGIALSWWTVRLFEQMLFGMPARDPLTFTFAAAVLFIAGLIAGWVPARRASRIDPVRALREA